MSERVICLFILLNINTVTVFSKRKITDDDMKIYRQRVESMFHHAYDGYIKHAYPYDELRPLTCDGHDTWGSYSLTLIDALDTLAIMGNYTEFRRVAELIIDKMNFDTDINASVFETNIRILGGLLSAHLFTKRARMEVEPGWPCSGPLLRLAEDVARRLLPAFDTPTGMPYGTVNLKHGVPKGETTVTCTAGVGTFLIEFGTLSRLTGDPVFEKVAVRAMRALWNSKSALDLVGNHIDVASGKWTALDSGIGGGIDSYFEYLVKGAIMFDIPEFLEHFRVYEKAIVKHVKRDDWYMWAHMTKGGITLPMFTSLDAYWPGIQSLLGDIDSAMKTIHNFHQVWRQFGFLPEYYNIPKSEAHTGREGYPLRPELIESAVYLYQATRDPYLLEIGIDMLEAIEHSTKTKCGYATVKNVNTHQLDNRMESFFLAETTKYLYLLFDPDNFIHNNGSHGTVIHTPNGECVVDAGGYFFTSEAHPIDAASVYCCSSQKKEDDVVLERMHDSLDLLSLFNIEDEDSRLKGKKLKSFTQDLHGDKFYQTEAQSSENSSSGKGFENSVMEILTSYLKNAEGADPDSSLSKLGASLELLKSQMTKLDSSLKDSKDISNEDETIVDMRKSTEMEEKLEILKPETQLENTEKLEPVSNTEQNKGRENLPNNDMKPEPPTPISQVAPTEAQTPPAASKYENVRLDESTDSSSGESLNEKGVEQLINVNISEEINSENVNSKVEGNSNLKQTSRTDPGKVPKSVVLSVKTDNTGQATVETSETQKGNSKHVFHITKFNTAKQSNLFNLENIYNLLGSTYQKDPVSTPNINHLYQTIKYYPLQYIAKPELMVCKSQPFHMRFSVKGEMFSIKND
ncbi:ER degradation-enhancing alpha-mannosidase-like protein 2 [Saccostrea echinata]|uniref:ER degradation-enhancing alpha-mannosidase-like protein 2 n=1 Tax=Saccostrea echinata TaxID=191078 RepID=UPI002A8278E8|nr:ER degradation-enhancing alpha-mannosidase-like protein 2 [Saccostrea echinata]